VENALVTLEKLPECWVDHFQHIEVAQAAKKQYPRNPFGCLQKKQSALLITMTEAIICKPRFACVKYAMSIAS